MPVKIPNELPASEILSRENIFVMNEHRATSQDIRPLRIGILNLMPTKIITEIQLLRLIGNTPLQVEVDLLHPSTYQSKNTSAEHLLKFYKTFEQISALKYDGFIITGAPIEHLDFEDVAYWNELKQIMEWSTTHVTSTLHICWGAQAGLYYHYNIKKQPLTTKQFGIFKHQVNEVNVPLVRGFDEWFLAPHSRYTQVTTKDVEEQSQLQILAKSESAGVYLVISRDGKQVFITGHAEYDPETLKVEYERDLSKGLDIRVPQNYFPNDDPSKEPMVTWRAHANLLFSNWLNYYVYQVTPFELD